MSADSSEAISLAEHRGSVFWLQRTILNVQLPATVPSTGCAPPQQADVGTSTSVRTALSLHRLSLIEVRVAV